MGATYTMGGPVCDTLDENVTPLHGARDATGTTHWVTLRELDNFFQCSFEADGKEWPSSEHYYQACKFTDPAGEDLREALRTHPSAQGAWSVGQSGGSLRADWESAKVDCMYRANLEKFSQNLRLRDVLCGTRGLLAARGCLFWKTWNEVILERIREELRPGETKNEKRLAERIAMMEAYRDATASGDDLLA